MGRTIMSIIMIGIGIAAIAIFARPNYVEIQAVKAEVDELDQALANSKRLQALRDELNAEFSSFTVPELERLSKLVPENIDNVKLILELDSAAQSRSLTLQNITVAEATENAGGQESVQSGVYETIGIGFTVSGGYTDFVDFLQSLEQSLRVIDISSLEFSSRRDSNDFDYSIDLETYWLN